MAENTIVWTRTAGRQLREVLSFWNKRTHSNRFSNKLLDKIDQRLAALASFPLEHPQSSLPEIRVAAMNHYNLFYKIHEDRIVIIAFWDNRQDPKKLLRILKGM